MKNKISDLNNILFEQLERINDDSLSNDDLEIVLKKAEVINGIAKTIVDSAKTVVSAQKMLSEYDGRKTVDMAFIGVNDAN